MIEIQREQTPDSSVTVCRQTTYQPTLTLLDVLIVNRELTRNSYREYNIYQYVLLNYCCRVLNTYVAVLDIVSILLVCEVQTE